MPWWSVLRDGLRRPRAGSSVAADKPSVQRHLGPEPSPAPPVQSPPEQAWRDLPALQRTLAEPIEPAAPLDAFTGSLTAHQNPSFLAPLSHRVDPDAGGLVDGLADLTPGHPISYSAAGELAVPHAAKPTMQRKIAVQRTLAEWPAQDASWQEPVGDPYGIDTVPMERPGIDMTGGDVVTGRGTSDAPLIVTAPTLSPTPPQPTVQRHAVASAGVTEEPVEAAGGMEAIEGLTVSRQAESTALPHSPTQLGSAASAASGEAVGSDADVPTLGRTAEDQLTGPDSMPLPGRTGETLRGTGTESVAETVEVSPATERAALPTAPVQRQATQIAGLGVGRTWPVVPEQAARAAAFPALPIVELPVARSAESGAPPATPTDARAASDLHLASASAESAASGAEGPADAPLSGFAAAISALHAGDEADAAVQRAADPGVEGFDGPSLQRPRRGGAEGSGGTSVGMPVQRLAVGPGEFVQAGQSGSGRGGSVPPAASGSALSAPTVGSAPGAGDPVGEASSREPGELSDAGVTSPAATSGQTAETGTPSSEDVDARLVDDQLPQLPVVTPERPTAARGSVAMPVVGRTPVQRSAAEPSGRTSVRTAGLLASRVPTLQLQQLSSATPAPPPVQRVTFLADAVRTGAVAQGLSAPTATTVSHRASGQQHSSAGIDSAGQAVRSVAALQRSVGSTTPSPHVSATATDSVSGAPASRSDRFNAFESDSLGDSVRWEPVLLEQAADDGSAVGAGYGIDEPVVAQRAVELPAARSAGPAGTTDGHRGSWDTTDSEIVKLDTYEAVRSVEPPAPPRRPATVMPPMPIVQRHVAAADTAAPIPHRSSSAGISFASMFSAASEAAETGYTTVQLQADDSSHALDIAEPETAPVASAAGPSVQREGEAPPPSAPAPGGASAGGAPAGADLDEMARRLFEPLSARLRAEFWLDRERAGLMTDARP